MSCTEKMGRLNNLFHSIKTVFHCIESILELTKGKNHCMSIFLRMETRRDGLIFCIQVISYTKSTRDCLGG